MLKIFQFQLSRGVTMMSIMLIIFFVASCNCADEFSSRARNFSLEIMYFTHLEHYVMSPFCVWNVMTGAYAGSRDATTQQIQRATVSNKNKATFFKKVKKFTENIWQPKSNGVELSSSIFIFFDKNTALLSSYINLLVENYNATLFGYDFKQPLTAPRLNGIIQRRFPTISDAFHSDDITDTSVILSNVVYFEGLLKTPFNASSTYSEIVYDENHIAVGSVNMMHQKGKLPYTNFEKLNSNILELPYGNDEKFCMLVLFPYSGVNPIDVYLKLDKISIREILTKLEADFNKNKLQEVDINLPRFRIRSSLSLQAPLNDMGVYDAFEPDLGNFQDISEERLYIHTVEHKTEIEFTEYKTVISAITPGYFDQETSTSNIKAQQPFIFFLMEKPTATIIFGGIYSRHRYLNKLT